MPPYQSRSGVGFKYALWCLAAGWWSLPGLVQTPPAIINNLMGGADVTGLAMPTASLEQRAFARKELKKSTERFGLVVLGLFILFLVGICLLAVYG